jgi:hypothetical protein
MTKKMLASAVGLVLVLTLLLNRHPNQFLFYALFPGAIVNLVITGGHGGTITAERVGFLTGFVTNILVYSGAAFLLLRLRKPSN